SEPEARRRQERGRDREDAGLLGHELRPGRTPTDRTSRESQYRGEGREHDLPARPPTRGPHPPSIPSAASDGSGSGSRAIRKPWTRPSRAARRGMNSAIWSAFGLASVLMWRISAWTAGGLPTSSSSRWVFVIASAFFSSAFDTRVACRDEST